MPNIDKLIARCLADQSSEGPCGPLDPWDDALSLTDAEPEDTWLFIVGVARLATNETQFAKLTSGPLAYFWNEHHKTYLAHLRHVARELPQLVNMLIANDRRSARAAHVMNLIDMLADRAKTVQRNADFEFVHEPPADLAALVSPGAHPLTERLRVPNWHSFQLHSYRRSPVAEAELKEIVDGYIRAPDPPDNDDEDDWWWALNRLVSDSPEQAWQAILQILARENDGVDVASLGAGALESLVSNHAEELLPQIEAELETNPPLIRALSYCYLFSLSEETLDRLALKCRSVLTAV